MSEGVVCQWVAGRKCFWKLYMADFCLEKIWILIKKPYLCTPIWKTGGWRGREFLERLALWSSRKRNFEKSFKKVWKLKNNAYLCSPVRKTGSRKRIWEVHWKDCFTVQEASTEKYNLSRSVNSFERIISVSDKLEIYKKLYNEEFDPGSGWTLAAGLTHASRGAARLLAITIVGDRRKGA